ncbi:MAG: hypothetical protein RLY43_2459 [Bacteroidota bacterium]|jgi:hypothetical protein
MEVTAPPAASGVIVSPPTPPASPPTISAPVQGVAPAVPPTQFNNGGPVSNSWSNFARNANLFEIGFQLLAVTALFFIINASAKRIKSDRKIFSDISGRLDELESKQNQLEAKASKKAAAKW